MVTTRFLVLSIGGFFDELDALLFRVLLGVLEVFLFEVLLLEVFLFGVSLLEVRLLVVSLLELCLLGVS